MTAIFNVSEARENFADVISKSAIEEVFIKRHNETVAVVISPAVWEKLCEAYEDLSDYTAALEVLNDPNEIEELEAIRRELGL
ncbi:MAG: Antitoxin Phd YefM, type toxin-antitoxin system [Actinomycetota bacterium]|jgi:prevent-host-death family protein